MKFTAAQIAELLEGTVEGDPNVILNQLTKIEEGVPNSLSFLANPKYTEYLYGTQSSVVIVNNTFKPEKPFITTLIRVKDAYASFAQLMRIVEDLQKEKSGIEIPSFIHHSSTIGEDVYIGAFAYIGQNVRIGKKVKIYPNCYIGDNVHIGDDCTLYAGVKIYENCEIKNFTTIHAGAVIGADGFGFAPNTGNSYDKIPQIGNVLINEGVEIGANTCIDRATMGSTIIHKGVKLDNLIQIAHNVEIGENTVIASQTAVAGSSKVGSNCMIGGQVAIAGHLTVANNVKIAGKTGIAGDVKVEGLILQGPIAFGIKDFQRSYIYFRKLPKIVSRLEELEKQLSK
ncbi:MAG: UDP-3-O-(3-hydroxymyristoyl)glucosamine N-acyltransferase [Flavobacteriales bacterium]|jgi:UDP-3-O-[3-hydroxymyristoyl] glucosamine N-acyltransferase|tara:strand:+ start:10366 stop:11391 length:1026 start_codon:yes stop_codon:yes gene_type:complete